MKVVYLAAPYGHHNQEVIEARMEYVYLKLADLISNGIVAMTPMTNHPLTKIAKLPGDWIYWKSYSQLLLSRSDLMIVYKLPGWDESSGVREEIEFAQEKRIPIDYHNAPDDLPEILFLPNKPL